jgi:hypothetical protein
MCVIESEQVICDGCQECFDEDNTSQIIEGSVWTYCEDCWYENTFYCRDTQETKLKLN